MTKDEFNKLNIGDKITGGITKRSAVILDKRHYCRLLGIQDYYIQFDEGSWGIASSPPNWTKIEPRIESYDRKLDPEL